MMQKIYTLFIFCLSVFGAIAQSCGNDGSSVCTATGGPPGGGFWSMDSLPCAVRGTAYNGVVEFTMFNTFDFQGFQTVDSIEFINMTNLPCGLCWAVNKTSRRYKAGELGCLKFSGTTNDASGQYKLEFGLKAWINHETDTGKYIPPFLVDQTGIRFFVRVKDNAGSNCTPVDTSVNANNLTASATCPEGISQIDGVISSLTIAPSAFGDKAMVSFFAERSGSYDLKITDITGKMVSSKTLEIVRGNNSSVIERGSLLAGIYFLSLTDGRSAITRKFTIVN
jgi:hypothetical protein